MKVKKTRFKFLETMEYHCRFLSAYRLRMCKARNISRIFSTLGADPHSLSYFWILPPLAGIIVQPIVGAASDRTWTRFRTSHSLSVHRLAGCGTRHGPAAQCRQFRYGGTP